MKFIGMILSVTAFLAVSTQAFADECVGKDGKKIEAKDEAACKAAGGEWKKAEKK